VQAFIERTLGPDQHISADAETPQRLVGPRTLARRQRSGIGYDDQKVVIRVAGGLAPRVGSKEVDSIRLIGGHQPANNLLEDGITLDCSRSFSHVADSRSDVPHAKLLPVSRSVHSRATGTEPQRPEGCFKPGLAPCVVGKVCGKVSRLRVVEESKGKQKLGRLMARTDNDMQRKATKSRNLART